MTRPRRRAPDRLLAPQQRGGVGRPRLPGGDVQALSMIVNSNGRYLISGGNFSVGTLTLGIAPHDQMVENSGNLFLCLGIRRNAAVTGDRRRSRIVGGEGERDVAIESLQKLVMRSDVGDLALFQHNDAMRLAHGGQSVGNHEGRSIRHQILKRRLGAIGRKERAPRFERNLRLAAPQI